MALTSIISEVALKLTILDGRDLDHGHRFGKPSFCAKVVVDGKESVTKALANAIWNEELAITVKAESRLKVVIICKHKKTKDDHIVGVNEDLDVLGTISNPNPGVIEVCLSRPGRDKAVGFVRCTVEVVKAHKLGRKTDQQMSLSWRTLNSADIIRKVIFNDDVDDLVPPQWACIISSLDGLVKTTQDLAELNSSAKIALGAVCAAIKLIIQQVARDERVEVLTETMSNIYYHIQDTSFDKIRSFELTLRRLVKVTTECAYFIASYKRKAFARRTLEGAILGVDSIIEDFEERFSQLRIEFLMGSTLQSTHTVLLVLNEVRNIETLLHLQHLPLIQNTGWIRTRTELTPEQEKVFDGLTIWAQNPDEQLVSVLVGKSCEEASLIAHKLCERFYGQKRLGSAVFFPTTTESIELSCKSLISTIARELAALHPTFAESIADVLAGSPSLALSSANLGRQFEDLLIHPLQSLTVIGPVLIVIDGLDRCSDQQTFVETLSAPHVLGRIPRNVKFLLAVGPQSQFLDPVIRLLSSSLRIWLTGGDIQSHLIMNSVWRDTSTNYRGSQLLDRLEDLEASIRTTPVYSRAELVIPWRPYPTITPTSALVLSEIRRVVTKRRHGLFLEPLLNQARQCMPPKLITCFESYACFVSIQALIWNRPFHVLFLELKDAVDQEISFWVQEIANTHHLEGIPSDILESLPNETSNHPTALPFLVLRYLNMTLKPNICRFEEITKLNKDINDLDDRLRENVPAALGLLSGCWSDWVAPRLQTLHEDHRRAALSELRTFLSSNLLNWIELISLLGCVDAGLKQFQLLEPVLSQMTKEAIAHNDDINFIHSAISDAIRFMIYFRTPIRDGGLFVHRLAFFAPITTFIHRTYAPEVVAGLNMTNWPYKFPIKHINDFVLPSRASHYPVLASLHCRTYTTPGSIKLWSLEGGAHLRTFELPKDSMTSKLVKFSALPSKNHFTFVEGGRVSVFDPDRSVEGIRPLELEGHACSLCYTPDETSLAIRVREGHLYFLDLATSEIRTYPSLFPSQKHKPDILEISPNNNHVATCILCDRNTSGHDSYTATVQVYDIASGRAQVARTLEHSHPEKFYIGQIRWSKDQLHMITIIRHNPGSNSFCCLWDGEMDDYRKLGIGPHGSADFGNNGVIILALEKEIRLINYSTLEVVIAIPLANFPVAWNRTVFGQHGLVLTRFQENLVLHDVSVESKVSYSFSTNSPLPRAYQENVFQNSAKHELRVHDLEIVDGWLVMKPKIKLVWIPPPFRRLKDKSMDQITISDHHNDVRLVLDCRMVEKYFL